MSISKTPRIDAHQHFWSLARGDYGWITPELKPLYRDFLPVDLKPLLNQANIEGTILVQAAPTVAETEYMLSLAKDNDFIKGVVGWVDFESPNAASQIEQLAKNPKLVGLRPMIQGTEDEWMLKENLTAAYEALIAANLTFDALTLPRHLKSLHKLLMRHNDMRVVIDHGSKPFIADGIIDGWAEDMAAIAKDSQAYCKISGLVTEAKPNWQVEDLQPYVDHLINVFGCERLLWGSDWPVCTLAASYDQWLKATENLFSNLSTTERDAICGGNAAHIYKL